MNTARFVGRVRKFVLNVDVGDRRKPSEFSAAAEDAVLLVRVFYAFLTYIFLTNMQFSNAFRGLPFADPLWPVELVSAVAGVEWLSHVGPVTAAAFFAALLAALFPGVLLFRVCVFAYCVLFTSVLNSYGSANHGRYLFVYASFALLFMPSAIGRPKEMSRRDAMTCNAAFWSTQAVLLLSYSLSGFWKFWSSGFELLTADGFVRVLLSRAMDDVWPLPQLVPFAASNELLSQFFYLSYTYMQFFMFLALFRPHLQKLFGVANILFHLGILFLLGFSAKGYIMLWFIFLVFSPFAPRGVSLSATARSLPVVGIPFRAWAAWRRSPRGAEEAWLVYDGECPFCANYSRLVNARSAIGKLELVNARNGGAIVEEIMALPYNLDKGMVLKMNGRYYMGDDALNMLALLSERRGVFNVLNRLAFGSRAVSWLAYPVLRLGRRAALAFQGKALMNR